MVRSSLLPSILIGLLCATAGAQQRPGKEKDDKSDQPEKSQQPQQAGPIQRPQRPEARPAPSPQTSPQPRQQPVDHRPVVIRMGASPRPSTHPSEPVRQSPDKKRPNPVQAVQPVHRPPVYGQILRDPATAPRETAPLRPQPGMRPSEASEPASHPVNAIAHRPYTPGYVRGKLRNAGVTSSPGLILDRSEMVISDRPHSASPRPERGPGNREIRQTAIEPRRFNIPAVREHMTRIDRPEYLQRLHHFDAAESERGRHYWHNESGFYYSHYVDMGGANWYGWYLGDNYFWTRYYGERWWWYDQGYGRWCFWNDNSWWWQDPNHVGDLYYYNNETYIPCNSADDQIAVTAPDDAAAQSFSSPDGGRLVKVFGEDKDAYLYDAATPAKFDPVYLASGVENVQFSDPRNGKPLEIVLKLDDGTFDLLDEEGNPYVKSPTRSIDSDD